MALAQNFYQPGALRGSAMAAGTAGRRQHGPCRDYGRRLLARPGTADGIQVLDG
jgi:hypothetical protein